VINCLLGFAFHHSWRRYPLAAAVKTAAAIAAATAALPDQPAAGSEGVVDVAVKLADGRRVRRRFHRSHPLQAIFSFLVSAVGSDG